MMSDRIFAGIWLLLCIAGLFVAWQISSEYSYEPVGPRPFPLGIIGLMLVCAVALLLRASQAPDAAARSEAQRRLCVRLNRQHTAGEAVVDPLETAS